MRLMKPPAEILSPDDYRNFRNVRAVAVLYIGVASLVTFVALGFLLVGSNLNEPAAVIAIAVGFSGLLLLMGIAGIVGSAAILRGNRKWSPLIWTVAAFYIVLFPVGTILSVALFRGLRAYFDSIDRIRLANGPDANLKPHAQQGEGAAARN